ncbi:hypothetical protein T440DRAFT_217323 [Plenodomus tracheiphilus IPT5]|uniref:DNA damage-inducible protein 1 n=1 Tax=Plenodomus tracheiphilus IPT5 TaxID=1408161 RepID=A0A6A7AWD3_9PLEO|nr:hypothetical protein T440DRAFT_217323 [Plenodomus tracheiphilus IPT5]
MPRVTISITAPGTQADNDLLTLELPPGSTVKDLKGFIEADTALPAASQSIYLNGQPVAHETQTLEDAGIRDGEMLAVMIRRNPAPRTGGPRVPAQPDPEGVRQHILMNPDAQNDLRRRDPELGAALNDPARWRETFAMRQRQADEAERERQNQIALLNEDPFNVEAQRKIEDLIRQDRVVENLQKAYDENPEVFVRVHMLYVNTEVNGVPVKAFVDSGAQRYRAKIDLEKNALCFQGQEVPFLHESEIPRSFEEAEMNEPTVAGPNGTEIGAKTGAVRPKGATAAAEPSIAAGSSASGPSSSSQPAAPKAPAPAPSPAAANSRYPQEYIQQLTSMFNVTSAEAVQALDIADGNIDGAASFLAGLAQ